MPPIRLDHIAMALPRIADAPSVLVGVLGGVPERMRPAGAFRWASWTYAGGGRIEILEPTGADGFLHRFLAAHGPGVHHVTFKVPDLDASAGGPSDTATASSAATSPTPRGRKPSFTRSRRSASS
jgi:4-hydroxyphenylpyruvate dioxygenase-like putative hemolysin